VKVDGCQKIIYVSENSQEKWSDTVRGHGSKVEMLDGIEYLMNGAPQKKVKRKNFSLCW